MSFKDSIKVTLLEPSLKALIPIDKIIGVHSVEETDWSAPKLNDQYQKKRITKLCLDINYVIAGKLYYGLDIYKALHENEKTYYVSIKEDFNIVCDLLRKSEAAEVLFSEWFK